MDKLDFDIAVFGVNEAETLHQCVTSIDRAAANYRSHIAVLLNGTTDNSIEILRRVRLNHANMTVYRFPTADKANAINFFLHELRLNARRYVSVDAYASLDKEALQEIDRALTEHPRALAASGVPLAGRSATTVRASTMKGGVLNGQFHILTSTFVDEFRKRGLRIPIQLYRGDGLLGSMACHAFDPLTNPWDDNRVIGVAGAGFFFRSLSPLRIKDLRRQYNRRIRQARGLLENQAIKSIIYEYGYSGLPENAIAMLREWLNSTTIPNEYDYNLFKKKALLQINRSTLLKASSPEKIF